MWEFFLHTRVIDEDLHRRGGCFLQKEGFSTNTDTIKWIFYFKRWKLLLMGLPYGATNSSQWIAECKEIPIIFPGESRFSDRMDVTKKLLSASQGIFEFSNSRHLLWEHGCSVRNRPSYNDSQHQTKSKVHYSQKQKKNLQDPNFSIQFL